MKLQRYFEDPRVLHLGTMETRNYYIPYCKKVPQLPCEESDEVRSLAGEDWYFAFYEKPERVPEEFAFHPGEDKNGGEASFDKDPLEIRENWKQIPVPSCIQNLGYDHHQYVNTRYPFPYDPPFVPTRNPSACYVKYFDLSQEQVQGRNYLYFEGVDSCFYLWINGRFAAYSQVSHSPSEIDISDHVRPGQNRMAVLVLKWCDGSYLEDQDKFRMTGIFRDVLLLSRPKAHLMAYDVVPELPAQEGGPAYITFQARAFVENPQEVHLRLQDAEGREVASGMLSPGKKRGEAESTESGVHGHMELEVKHPHLWNAEDPYLYDLEIECGNEFIVEKVGLCRVSVQNGVILVNGKLIKLKGVNRHDSDPYTGYTISPEQALRDLKLMKEHNINAIRTSHYPNAPWFPLLCEKYGFYMIGESDIEIHGTCPIYDGGQGKTFGLLAQDPMFEEGILDRVRRNVQRDRNRRNIIMWSLGNEGGYGPGFEKAGRMVHEMDSTRLVHYESSIWETGTYHNDTSMLDVYSRMYPSCREIDEYFAGNKPRKPYVLCEFIHAMGNGPGDIEDYMKQIYRYDGLCGGFVWEWCDHAVVVGHDDNGKALLGYGGDSGELYHDGNFCVDGLVSPERVPHVGLLEWKNALRPVRAMLPLPGRVVVLLCNMLDFTDLNGHIDLRLELEKNGEKIWEKVMECPATIPHGESLLEVDGLENWPLDAVADGDVYLRVVYLLRKGNELLEAGFELGFDQFELHHDGTASAMLLTEGERRKVEGNRVTITDVSVVKAMMASSALKVEEDDCEVRISGENFDYVIDKDTALFSEMRRDGRNCIVRPMEFGIYRAPTDNDREINKKWIRAGYEDQHPHAYYVRPEKYVMQDENGKDLCDCVRVDALVSLASDFRQPSLRMRLRWTVMPGGAVRLRTDVVRDTHLPFLPRFGVVMYLPKADQQVEYFGLGPNENYSDKCLSSWRSLFKTDVDGLYVDYFNPQENGAHRVNALRVGRLRAASEQEFSFNASFYGDQELRHCKHDYELQKQDFIELHLDYRQSGVGSAACGQELLPAYRLDEERFVFDVTILP